MVPVEPVTGNPSSAVASDQADDLPGFGSTRSCVPGTVCVCSTRRRIFEFDVDGLAYVKADDGELRADPGSRGPVPASLRLDVIDAAKECPGDCIHVLRARDDVEIASPEAPDA